MSKNTYIVIVSCCITNAIRRIVCVLAILLAHYSAYTQESNHVSYRDTLAAKRLIEETNALRHVDTDSAIKNLMHAYQISYELNYLEGIAKSLTNLGLMYMDKGEYTKSLQIYKRCVPYSKLLSVKNPKAIVILYNNIAAVYGNQNIFDSAARYYYRALEQYDKHQLSDTTILLSLYTNLGGRLIVLKRTHQAKYYLAKAEPIALATDNSKMLAKVYVGYAAIKGIEKKYDSARYFALKALDIFEEVRDPASHIIAFSSVGDTYVNEGKPQKALTYYDQAFKIKHDAPKTAFAVAYRGRGKAYYKLGKYKQAEKDYLESLKLSHQANALAGIEETNKALVDVYTALGDYKKALFYRNEYAKIVDSSMNEKRLRTFGQLEIKYRTSQKDKELAEKKLQLAQQRNEISVKNKWIVIICIASLLLIGLIANNFRIRRQRQVLQIKNLKNEKEMEQLKATMKGEEKERVRIARELHDGIMIQFSSVQMNLSALNEKMPTIQNSKLNTIIDSLNEAIKDLRKSAHNLMPDMLLKEGLTEAVHYFCVRLQESSKTEIDFQSYGIMTKIASEYELMLYRMIQELLQNIIKHAKATKVLVQLNFQSEIMSITVEDDGVGVDTNSISLHRGMGLHQIKERIQSLNGHFTISANKPHGTSVYIELETRSLQQPNLTFYADKSFHS